jgi:hypothetical protein
MVDPIQKLAMVPRLWSGRNDGRRRELRSPILRRAMTANSGHGRRSGQGAPSVRSTSSTGNILSPPAITPCADIVAKVPNCPLLIFLL